MSPCLLVLKSFERSVRLEMIYLNPRREHQFRLICYVSICSPYKSLIQLRSWLLNRAVHLYKKQKNRKKNLRQFCSLTGPKFLPQKSLSSRKDLINVGKAANRESPSYQIQELSDSPIRMWEVQMLVCLQVYANEEQTARHE